MKLCEVNHLSNTGKEIKRDSESSGERNWRSLNRNSGVAGLHGDDPGREKLYVQQNDLGKSAEESESLVSEARMDCLM